MNKEMTKKRHLIEMEFETEPSKPAVMSANVCTKSNKRGPDELRKGNWHGGQTDTKTGMKPLSRKDFECLETRLNIFSA